MAGVAGFRKRSINRGGRLDSKSGVGSSKKLSSSEGLLAETAGRRSAFLLALAGDQLPSSHLGQGGSNKNENTARIFAVAAARLYNAPAVANDCSGKKGYFVRQTLIGGLPKPLKDKEN